MPVAFTSCPLTCCRLTPVPALAAPPCVLHARLRPAGSCASDRGCCVRRYGHFSGINRKVQLTYLRSGQPPASSGEEGRGAEGRRRASVAAADAALLPADCRKDGPSLLLVLKWGGELTPAGRVQAEELGRAFRCMYPGGQGSSDTHTHTHTGTAVGPWVRGWLRAFVRAF